MIKKRRHAIWGLTALLAFVAGCSSPSHSTEPKAAAAASPLRAALCASSPYDESAGAAAIHAVQAKYPKVTDARAAYALSLLPPNIADTVGLTVTSGTPTSALQASSDLKTLVVRSGSNVAPAEVASDIMFVLTTIVAGRSRQLDPTLIDIPTIASTALAVELDTYLNLAMSQPETLQGARASGEDLPGQAQQRLRGAATAGLTGVNTAAFAAAPQFWNVLASYMGTPYYRPSPAIPNAVWLRPPVPAGQAQAVATNLKPTCGA